MNLQREKIQTRSKRPRSSKRDRPAALTRLGSIASVSATFVGILLSFAVQNVPSLAEITPYWREISAALPFVLGLIVSSIALYMKEAIEHGRGSTKRLRKKSRKTRREFSADDAERPQVATTWVVRFIRQLPFDWLINRLFSFRKRKKRKQLAPRKRPSREPMQELSRKADSDSSVVEPRSNFTRADS